MLVVVAMQRRPLLLATMTTRVTGCDDRTKMTMATVWENEDTNDGNDSDDTGGDAGELEDHGVYNPHIGPTSKSKRSA